MENNNGKGIFYGVIGVATLIVAIIGATFAYFTATTTSTQTVTGAAATAGLNVGVIRMTGFSASEGAEVTPETASYVMVPQLDSTLDLAIKGVRGEKKPDSDDYNYGPACIDAGGSLVCSIYRIVVQNTGSAPIIVSGDIDFAGSSVVTNTDGKVTIAPAGENETANNLMNHLKWARLTQPTTIVDKSYDWDDATEVMGEADANKADAEKFKTTFPTTLLDYTANNAESEPYQTTTDGQKFYFANAATTINQYLYGMEIEYPADATSEEQTAFDNANVDLLGSTTVKGPHKAHYDLIDPTNDLSTDYKSFLKVDDSSNPYADGKWYLEANGNAGDTKVFYIVVWISENNLPQNQYDQGSFVGTVTFKSSEGSGATSTFTEAYRTSLQ